MGHLVRSTLRWPSAYVLICRGVLGAAAHAAWLLTAPGMPAARAWTSDDLMCHAHQSPAGGSVLQSVMSAKPPLSGKQSASASSGESTEPRARSVTMHEIQALLDAQNYRDALGRLDDAARRFPRLEDRFALMQGEAWLGLMEPQKACESYRVAEGSIDTGVAARARVGLVRCAIAGRDRKSEQALAKLLKRYPELPDALALRLELARAREHWGDVRGAIELYQSVDIGSPSSEQGRAARQALETLRSRGVVIAPVSVSSRLDRVEALVRWGGLQEAQQECQVLASESLPPAQAKRLQSLTARIGRLLHPTATPTEPTAAASTVATAAQQGESLGEVGLKLQALSRGGNFKRIAVRSLVPTMELAAAHGFKSAVDDLLIATGKRRVPARTRFELAMLSAGVASDRVWLEFLSPLTTDRKYAIHARYHMARGHERAGDIGSAVAGFEFVRQNDRSAMRFHGRLAELRLHALQAATAATAGSGVATPPGASRASAMTVSPNQGALRLVAGQGEGASGAPSSPTRQSLQQAGALLGEVAQKYGERYPWFGRAADLLQLDDAEGASDELYEGYLAWRQSLKRGLPRAGLEAVYCGRACPRPRLDARTRLGRRGLDEDARRKLADVAMAIGDVGTSLNFASTRSLSAGVPRPYEAEVLQAARAHGVDPELLLAVMRVESVFQKRIISYAGAIGLMQIMPRTGKLVAQQMGNPSFSPADLLDPQTNIEMSAWYLSSLLKRFDGSVPLALAAYNGGPHNVRRWMHATSASMPLDAFLELIPFGQTHHYVRRVYGHYLNNLAASGKPLPQLSWALPRDVAFAGVWF